MVRQGCLLLPYLPILSVEVLAVAIRGDNEIRGISVRNVKCKLKKSHKSCLSCTHYVTHSNHQIN